MIKYLIFLLQFHSLLRSKRQNYSNKLFYCVEMFSQEKKIPATENIYVGRTHKVITEAYLKNYLSQQLCTDTIWKICEFET